MAVTRRQFLTYAGVGTLALLAGRALLGPKSPGQNGRGPRRHGPPPSFFQPIEPSLEDQLILPEGYRYDVVVKWDDALGSRGPHGAERFGFNNDFIAYFPIDALSGGNNSSEGLLWVNHEYPDALFVSHFGGGRKTEEQIIAEKLSVGGSIVQVARRDGHWVHVPGSRYARRFTALYPEIEMTGPAAFAVPRGIGTLANCSGGRSPWMTALSCEENFQYCNLPVRSSGMGWSDVAEFAIDEQQYGWVVEVDPFGELPPQKHTALGRFAHENCAIRISPGSKLVVYMGDDANDQFFYQLLSAGAYRAGASRAENRRLLTEGTLYVADFGACVWKALDFAANPELRRAGFRDQADVLIRARQASAAIGATPLDRPEDCEIHPRDGSVYLALSNNLRHGNYFGQIVRLVEANDNPESESFQYEVYLCGGPQSGLASPDNLVFDRAGNLWVMCDVATERVNRGAYLPFGNNGVFVVPTQGPAAGDAFQFGSGPVGAELTGPWFNENEDTLFLSVQHPGEDSTAIEGDGLRSHWPEGGASMPRPSVVAITGFWR